MSDPDFLDRLSNTNRFESANQEAESAISQARLLEKKKAFWGETINLKLTLLSTANVQKKDEPFVTIWKIPRFRLNKEMLEDACNRANAAFMKDIETPAPTFESRKLVLADKSQVLGEGTSKVAPLVISHLHHQETNTVIFPDQMQTQCKPSSSVIYDVIVRSAGKVTGGGVLSSNGLRRTLLKQQLGNSADGMQKLHYDGDLCFVLHNVPRATQNKQYMVTSNDIRRWIVDGCIKDEHSMTVPHKRVLGLQQALEKLEREHRSLCAMGTSTELIKQKIARTKAEMKSARQDEDEARAAHFANCSLSITLLESKGKSDTSSWKISVKGRKKEYYQRLIEKQSKWCIVPMYAFGDAQEETNHRKSKSKPEDKNDDFVMSVRKSDQVKRFVDVGGVEIKKLPDGFGVYESFVVSSLSDTANGSVDGRHYLYHGHFHEGVMDRDGSLYTDEGVYSGSFQAGEKVGHGKMEYSDNISLTGDFALWGDFKCNESNPYSRGMPHGNVHIIFANGDEYEGQMQNGNITGKGTYRYAMENSRKRKEPKKFIREVEGEWINGTLQNNHGIEGQGCSNLLRSFMFDGKRLWGP